MAFKRTLNRTEILGRLTNDPQPITKDGKTIGCRFQIAVDRADQKNGQPNQQQPTDYIPCTAWGYVSASIIDRCKKGQLVLCFGHWQSGSYEDRNSGKRVYTNTNIIDSYYDLMSGNSSSGADNRKVEPYRPESALDETMRDYLDSDQAIDTDDLPF